MGFRVSNPILVMFTPNEHHYEHFGVHAHLPTLIQCSNASRTRALTGNVHVLSRECSFASQAVEKKTALNFRTNHAW